MKRNSGFTLIELMIVVAIIAIIAAIAIPNLLRSRMSANEAGAAGGIRTISTGEVAFQSAGIVAQTNGLGEYATLAQLSSTTLGNAFIDSALGTGQKSGYTFAATPVTGQTSPTYSATATPLTFGSTGLKAYFVDESGVIRFDGTSGSASVSSPPMN